jgi:oxygen-dependent protoporphyrinogen oxidase
MTIGIVGGGITGLALQHYLRESGIDSVVLEAAAEPGGVINSLRVDGRVLEVGPQRTRLSPQLKSLVESLGVSDELIEGADFPLYVYRDEALRRVQFTVRDAIATDLLSWRGKLRLLLEPVTAPPRRQETVEEFLTRTLGSEAARYLIDPLYGGIYASHPDEMYMKHSFLRALDKHGVSRSLLVAAVKAKLRRSDPPPVVSFVDGMQTLPQALYEDHQERVHLETPVEAIREVGSQFRLETPRRGFTVDSVVLTTPADVTATLLESIAPESASALNKLTYNSLVTVHLEAEDAFDATGFQVQYEEDFRTLGATCNASLFGRDSVYTCSGSATRAAAMTPTSGGIVSIPVFSAVRRHQN